ncbi:MAG: hypothetical protein COT88_00260 [Candidatus Colwellbacteria bacterium CG10_big_fil_rev_8_21_14_0_10_41_28]|uniref:Uncharacterized protein n=1 Tax=Candidatus Colwellbacteria bacterium CG10_big_fil_rev_8_21_14_0_10_41_28 TaxID=1974539 RepID=A0A2H0VHX7_9BACT|nr:MAG: hypothetical protein COT88_00260 [Candidatus Colwellbacteria bacterium CG10_big_fil_rev_8_21_14_0_10_41_28]
MKPKKRKNVSNIIADVRKPQKKELSEKRKNLLSLDQVGAGVLILFFILVLSFSIGNLVNRIKNFELNWSDITGTRIDSYEAIGGSAVDSMNQKLLGIEESVESLSLSDQISQTSLLFTTLSDISSIIRELELVLAEVNENAIELSFTGRGDELIELLDSGRGMIGQLHLREQRLNELAKASEQDIDFPDFSFGLDSVSDQINSLTQYIGRDGGVKTLALFVGENGELLNRYSTISIKEGNVTNFSVRESTDLGRVQIIGNTSLIDSLPNNLLADITGVLLVGNSNINELDSSEILKLIIRELFLGNVEFYPND